LIVLRRSGGRVYYRLAAQESRAWGARAARLLRRALGDPAWATSGWGEDELVHVSDDRTVRPPRAILKVFDVVFDAATAFTNVRRLQILQLLGTRGACGLPSVVGELRMSPAACSRHTGKLSRRGYVVGKARARWALSKTARTSFHGALGALVMSGLAGPCLRSSRTPQ
ncbi:hypothetical protein ACFL09_03495, partial [Planctomycetota bacterium]